MLPEIKRAKQETLEKFNRALDARIETKKLLLETGTNPELLQLFEDFLRFEVELSAILDNLLEQEDLLNFANKLK